MWFMVVPPLCIWRLAQFDKIRERVEQKGPLAVACANPFKSLVLHNPEMMPFCKKEIDF